MKTFSQKASEVTQDWYIIDAKDQVLGRLATKVARILSGKDKPTYTPHIVGGDFVVIINSSKIKVTGQKLNDKIYYHHTGYPGGIRDINLRDQLEKDPNKVLERAVAGMLPKNKLQAKMLKNLKIYSGSEHPHEPQNPKVIKLEERI